MAVSADGHRWFVLNASPDIREQLARVPHEASPSEVRSIPIEAVVLTDAEVDHSLGLVLLREGRALDLYATDAVKTVLECDSHVLSVTRAFAAVRHIPLLLDTTVELHDRHGARVGLTIEAFAVSGDPPRFASAHTVGHTVGLAIRDARTEGVLVYVPGCGAFTPPVERRLREADAILFDGTFWTDDELVRLGISSATASDIGHVPVSGPDGSLPRLADSRASIRVYTHINNTNPMLLEDSPERRAVTAAHIVVGDDGMAFEV